MSMLFFILAPLLLLGYSLESKIVDGVVDNKSALVKVHDAGLTDLALVAERYQIRIARPMETSFQASSSYPPQKKAYQRLDSAEYVPLLRRHGPFTGIPSRNQSTNLNPMASDSSASVGHPLLPKSKQVLMCPRTFSVLPPTL